MKELTTKQYQALWAIPDVEDVCFTSNGKIVVCFKTLPNMMFFEADDDFEQTLREIVEDATEILKEYAPAEQAPESHAALINAMRFT